MNSTNESAPLNPGPEPGSHDLGFALPGPTSISRGRLFVLGCVGLGVLAGAFLFSYLPRAAAHRELEQYADAARHALPRFAVVKPKLVSSDHALRLPGNIQPLEEAVIYARASGYVKRWLVDIGQHVQNGALLAELDVPEVDQELSQARAALAQSQANVVQAEANKGLAQIQFERAGKLVEAGVAARQELDQSAAQSTVGDANVKVAKAAVAAQEANIRRLVDLQSFARVTAPFAGVITARSIERGSLVTAGNATPMFRLAATDPVRVFLQVPQDLAPSVVVGVPAKVSVREFANTSFLGTVARTAGALDAGTRTLNTEIRVPNSDGKLLVGMYTEVELTLSSPHRVFELPSTALLSDANGLRVAVVTSRKTVHLQPIVIERDLGATVQVASGIDSNDQVIQIASADLSEGENIELAH